ncbi:Glyco_hydro_1 domain-containing protein [Cephalotus follicularis]|uniref:Glyco_hydro_1 domain-containing protein n=1 Tax=Cephalotus follicularis TaxID=3775 RepID=A0A1Q3BNG2_CEPFO|nr:Glyco_hydro_1 domain-containing protein [Cephalotus follicularis]
MAIEGYLVLCLVFLVSLFASTELAIANHVSPSFTRSSFPAGFVFGTSSSSYQYEGAANEDGRGPSIWDTFTHKYPDKIADESNGDVADDFYHRFKDDVRIMKEMGMDAFRFSISWSRVLPRGKLSGGENIKGISFYNNLINELLSNGLQPFVTIFHWDLPQALEDEYGGFLSPRIAEDFKDFAQLCFKEFGDRVKHWITINEPWTYSSMGYDLGTLAPGRCSKWVNGACPAGNSAIEPYVVAHYMLLSHATAVKLYKEKYQASQKGKIGITNVCHWMVPYSRTKSDINAAKRALDFMFGWFMDPLTNGDYPHSMHTLVGIRLPKFSKRQSLMVKGSFDFIGVNYYTSFYVANIPIANSVNISYSTDSLANLTSARNGVLIGPQAASSWLHAYPRGIRDLLIYTKIKYNNPTIYVTENGIDEVNNNTLPLKQALKDPMRIDYYYRHLLFLSRAIKEGVNVKGYFAWSLLDNFEWSSGYAVRFGINFIDYKNGLKRYPKQSAIWFQKFLLK